ncbi:hypothetical protein C3L33_13757, partial [Rhododendron williamsianum]
MQLVLGGEVVEGCEGTAMEGLTNARKLEGGEGSEHRPRPICSVAEPKELGLHQFGPSFKDTVGERFECIGTGGGSRRPYCILNHVDTGEARRYAPEICDAIFANCFAGGLETLDMIQKSQELCMRWVELEAVEVFLVEEEGCWRGGAGREGTKALAKAVKVVEEGCWRGGAELVMPWLGIIVDVEAP